MNDKALMALARAVKFNVFLHSIDLRNTLITDASVAQLIDTLADRGVCDCH
jgi:hypothetical protein